MKIGENLIFRKVVKKITSSGFIFANWCIEKVLNCKTLFCGVVEGPQIINSLIINKGIVKRKIFKICLQNQINNAKFRLRLMTIKV